ncbi:hypothetical protein AOQ84DRAFT_363698 [Glonium stellatum]|uniref:Uncharacterized protein n=1 Tax=Glonium stellatum TaxID=574774 RepID=A0A8E2JTG2_9PEZI|nr:hypothetical protein AOQ84DRAFT_363698 [Glonium stellatum]
MAAPDAAELLIKLQAMRQRHLDEQTALHARHRGVEANEIKKAHAAESAVISALRALLHAHAHLPPPQTPPAQKPSIRKPVTVDLGDSDSDTEELDLAPAPPRTPRTPPVPSRLLQAFKQHSGPPLLPHHSGPPLVPAAASTPTRPPKLPRSPTSDLELTPTTPSTKRYASPIGSGIMYDEPRYSSKKAKTTTSTSQAAKPISNSANEGALNNAPSVSPPSAASSAARTLPSRAARAAATSRVAGIMKEEWRTRRMSDEALSRELGGRLSEDRDVGRDAKISGGEEGSRKAFLAERARGDRFLAREMSLASDKQTVEGDSERPCDVV